jgi:chromosome segregation ATPase
MRKTVFAAMLFVAADGLCQTAVKEPDTLQSLLQIALYGLQMQDAAVARAAQRLDDARNKCSAAELERHHAASEIQRLESGLSSGTLGEADAKAIQSALPQMKIEVEAKAAGVLSCQIAEGEASSQLRNDQTKLADLQDRIERLDKTLEKLGAAGK